MKGSAALKPSTEEALLDQLEWMRQFDVRALERYFPKIAETGVVDYALLDRLSNHQADALRFQLSKAIRFVTKQMGRQQARQVTFLSVPGTVDHVTLHVSHEEIKQRLLIDALSDLCSAYSLPNPLGDR